MACEAIMNGESGKMVAFERVSTEPYEMKPFFVDIDKVMMYERTMPDEFINEEGNGVTEAFKEWCKPLIGGELPKDVYKRQPLYFLKMMVSFQSKKEQRLL